MGVACGQRVRATAGGAIDAAIGLGAVAVLIAANGLFVAAEFALVAVDRTRVEQRAEAGSRAARTVVRLLQRLSFHLSGAQLGITITSLLLGFIAEPTLARLLRPLLVPLVGEAPSRGASIAAALALATVVQMVLGELVPKNLAIARPLPTALALSAPIRIYGLVFGPLISFLNAAANATVRRMGIEPKEEISPVRSLPELALLFEASAQEGALGDRVSRLLTRSVRFREKSAADVLVPRVAVVAIGQDATAADLAALAAETGHSRFPVIGGALDDVRGVVHAKAVHAVAPDERATTRVATLATEVPAVPESMDLETLLFELQRSRSHLAVVLDEFGGTAGIVTLEDLVEEIVGEIADEHDQPVPDLTVWDRPGEWVLPGTAHPDEVAEACGFRIPEGDYETIAGFLLDRLGFVPRVPGDVVEAEGWMFAVAAVDGLRIAEVRVVAPAPGEEAAPAPAGEGL